MNKSKRIDDVLRELGQLYDFNREIQRFELRKRVSGEKVSDNSQELNEGTMPYGAHDDGDGQDRASH